MDEGQLQHLQGIETTLPPSQRWVKAQGSRRTLWHRKDVEQLESSGEEGRKIRSVRHQPVLFHVGQTEYTVNLQLQRRADQCLNPSWIGHKAMEFNGKEKKGEKSRIQAVRAESQWKHSCAPFPPLLSSKL